MTRKVWYVFQGGESSERFNLLIGQTGQTTIVVYEASIVGMLV